MKTDWARTRNLRPLSVYEVPRLPVTRLRDDIIALCGGVQRDRARPVAFFGVQRWEGVELWCVLARDSRAELLVASSLVQPASEYVTMVHDVPAMHIFERELYEEFGIVPRHHPWLKPVRALDEGWVQDQHGIGRKGWHHGDDGCSQSNSAVERYPFFTVHGDILHQVGVGPVHAGVIEPGHFRFFCRGEEILHLEIALGYQHRGVESLLVQRPAHAVRIAESVAGDSVIAHATAAANAMEVLGNCVPSLRALTIRSIALEMERAAMHIGDLGALAGDVAFLPGMSFYGATRTLVINGLLSFSGSRFGRGLIRAGGVGHDIDGAQGERLDAALGRVRTDLIRLTEAMFASPSVLSRFERTGIVSYEDACRLGFSGPTARASGVPCDVRFDHPFGLYRLLPIHPVVLDGGDVFSRAWIRYAEAVASLDHVRDRLASLPAGTLVRRVAPAAQAKIVVSMVEGWRGEVVHAIVTDEDGHVCRHRVQDPSLANWFALALAVRGNGISDFPICNKSFNLSYCGNDL